MRCAAMQIGARRERLARPAGHTPPSGLCWPCYKAGDGEWCSRICICMVERAHAAWGRMMGSDAVASASAWLSVRMLHGALQGHACASEISR